MKSSNQFIISTSIIGLILISCQKETQLPVQDEPAVMAKSIQGSLNNSKKERTILFISQRDGGSDYEIFSMDPSGENIVQLTDNLFPDGRASWSANGQHIAFAAGTGAKDIYVMNANGKGLINITNTPDVDEDWPEWSVKGNKLIFSGNATGNHEIYSFDPDEGIMIQLTNRIQDDKWPTYSPDGSRIAFQSDMGTSDGRTEIFVMNADGSGDPVRLTNHAGFDQMPTWSPDGSQIAFMSTRDGNPNIYKINGDGSGTPVQLTSHSSADARPSWSRQTNKIFFSSQRIDGKWNIFWMNPDGSSQTAITTLTTYHSDFPFAR
jgi:Tol biopolymer transport system component